MKLPVSPREAWRIEWLFWEANPTHQVVKTRIRAKIVDPQVRFDVIADVQRPFFNGLFQEFKRFVLLAEACMDCGKRIGRDVDAL